MVESDYVIRLGKAINELEWARRDIYGSFSVKGHDEHIQDIEHIINQITTLIADHCNQNVGEL